MRLRIVALLALSLILSNSATAQSLSGSQASMRKQNEIAQIYDYSFLTTSTEVDNFVRSGYLVKVYESSTLELHAVSHPYARPEVKVFLERLSAQYSAACGQKLIVTSLTRPISKQPSNASSRSVHPTGMAVDLRRPAGKCRSWLESTLLSLERGDVLDVTMERYPPHYHVAVFTKRYDEYVANLTKGIQEYTVRRGDTLSTIARRHGTSIQALRVANGIRGDLISIGQKLRVPVSGGEQVAAVSEVSHKVKRGDTLWSLATLYGSSVSSIRAENALPDDFLQVGQELKITLTPGSN